MKIENRGDPSRKIQGFLVWTEIWNLPSEPYLINTFVLGKWILPKDKVSMNRVDALSQGGSNSSSNKAKDSEWALKDGWSSTEEKVKR